MGADSPIKVGGCMDSRKSEFQVSRGPWPPLRSDRPGPPGRTPSSPPVAQGAHLSASSGVSMGEATG